jgi:hypothetical protein
MYKLAAIAFEHSGGETEANTQFPPGNPQC